MKTVKRLVAEEFHYAMDGINAKRWPAGSMAEVKAEDVDRLIAEGNLAADQETAAEPVRKTRKRK